MKTTKALTSKQNKVRCKHDHVQYDENGGRCLICGAYFYQDKERDYYFN